MSIKAKVVLVVVACLGAMGLGTALVAELHFAGSVESAAREAVRRAAAGFAQLERQDVEKLGAALEALAANAELARAFARQDRERLLALAAPTFARLRDRYAVTHFYFIDPGRTCFLRVHRPELFGDEVPRSTLAEAARTGETASGKDLGKTAFALRVVRPWLRGGRLLGYLELGEEIGHFLERVRGQTGDDLALVVDKSHLDRAGWAEMTARSGERDTWEESPGVVVVDATRRGDAALRWAGNVEEVPDGGLLAGQVRRDGATLVRGLAPVRDAGGRKVAALLVLHDASALRDGLERQRWSLVALAVGLALGGSAVLLLLLRRLVFARLDRMMVRMEDLSERLAGGDYDVGRELVPSAPDEVGRFEGFFGRFLSVIGDTLKQITGARG